MKYICANCNEEFDINDFKIGINNSKVVMCPYCNFPTIEKNKYEKLKDELNNSDCKEEDLKNVLENEHKLYEKVKGTQLEKVLEDIKAMYRLLKNPMEKWKSKIIAIAALAYAITPADVIPDFLPAIGLVDDAAFIMLAMTSLGNDIQKYKKGLNVNIGVNKNNITTVYHLNQDSYEYQTSATYKKNLLIWDIPVNKKNNLYANLITDKIINGNEIYVLNNCVNQFLIPFNNFDQYITDNIFNEAVIILKALGVKKIKYTKKMISTSNKKIATKLKAKSVLNAENYINMEDVSVQNYEDESIFGKVDLAGSLKNTEFIDKLIWYFSDNSIIDESVFRDRFEQGLAKKKISKELDCNSMLDVNSRVNIKKYCKVNNDVDINQYLKVLWNVEVEYCSLADIDREELKNIYNNMILRIDKRREELVQN